MEGWMHEIWDLFTIRETRPSVHRFKDSAAQFPFLGQFHRVINHNNWCEYAKALGLKATNASDVLNSGLADKLLGIYAFMPAEQVPYLLQEAYVDAIVSISHVNKPQTCLNVYGGSDSFYISFAQAYLEGR